MEGRREGIGKGSVPLRFQGWQQRRSNRRLSMKAKTVWKIPWRTNNMSEVSLKVLQPHYGLSRELLVGRSFNLRTRPNMSDRQRIGQGLLYRINVRRSLWKA